MWSEVLGGDISDIADFSDALGGDFVEMSYKMAVLVKLYDISTGTIHFTSVLLVQLSYNSENFIKLYDNLNKNTSFASRIII